MICCSKVSCEWWGVKRRTPLGCTLTAKKGWVEWMHLCIEGAIKIAYRKIEMFHLPSHSIAFFALLNVSKFTKRPTTCSKKVGVFKFPVEVVDKQGDYPSFFVIKSGEEGVDASFDSRESRGLSSDLILHSKGRITYRPSFSEILGAQIMLLTWTSPLIAIAMQKSTSIVYPILWRRQIQLCLNTVRKVECHLSQESSPIFAMASHFGQNT